MMQKMPLLGDLEELYETMSNFVIKGVSHTCAHEVDIINGIAAGQWPTAGGRTLTKEAWCRQKTVEIDDFLMFKTLLQACGPLT